MKCSMLQHSFASSRNREVCEGSKPTCSHSSRTHVWAGLHHPPQSSWYHDGPLHHPCRQAHVLLGRTNVHEEFRPSSSALFGKQFWALSLVVEDQVRGVVCDAAVQADIQVQDLFFLPSVSETADSAQHWRGVFSSASVAWAPLHCLRTLGQLVVSSRG